MKNENKSLFHDVVFDDYKLAQETYEACERDLKRNNIGLLVSTIVMFINCLFVGYADISDLIIAFVLAAVACLIGGGLLQAIGFVRAISGVFWFIIPIFPLDIIIGLSALITACILTSYLPVAFILFNRIQIQKDYDAAKEYLSCFLASEPEA